jgi:hypothetical protein
MVDLDIRSGPIVMKSIGQFPIFGYKLARIEGRLIGKSLGSRWIHRRGREENNTEAPLGLLHIIINFSLGKVSGSLAEIRDGGGITKPVLDL